MAIRSTAYLTHNGKEFCFYIQQDTDNKDKLCVTVHAKKGSAVFYICREGANVWRVVSQFVPQWVNEIKPLLVTYLEENVFQPGYY